MKTKYIPKHAPRKPTVREDIYVMRKPTKTVLFPTYQEIKVQDNGNGTWTALIEKPIGDGTPYTTNTMELAVKLAAVSNGFRMSTGEIIDP
jgi:hypothetical protein